MAYTSLSTTNLSGSLARTMMLGVAEGEGCDGGGGKNKLALGMVDRDEDYRVCMGLKISRSGGLRRRTVFSSKCLNG